ncbi:MAG TPA: hypothetical protein VHX38_28255 [Pseudonocardiaceae bacterium]|jgi:hypothetical protein|nr:hypothetical protein [Pseudonocardiaceae bacterium]
MSAVGQWILMSGDHLDVTAYSDPTELLTRLREANHCRADTPHDGFVWDFVSPTCIDWFAA